MMYEQHPPREFHLISLAAIKTIAVLQKQYYLVIVCVGGVRGGGAAKFWKCGTWRRGF